MNQMIPRGITVDTIDSREVAKMVEKRHDHLLRDVDSYVEVLENSCAPKSGVADFFIESSYIDAQGKSRRCFLCTRKGCEMIAHKMTGEKGIQFTAAYIERFHELEQKTALPDSTKREPNFEAQMKRLEIMDRNARQREAKLYLKVADEPSTEVIYKKVLHARAIEVVSGQKLLPYPELQQNEYTATEAAPLVGLPNAHAVGVLANKLGLKAPEGSSNEYGRWIHSKSRSSSREVKAWVYFDAGLDALKAAAIG